MSHEVFELFKDLTHAELMEITTSYLSTIFQTDSLLKDIPPDISVDEVIWKTAVEHGKSITLKVLRDQEPHLNVIVPQLGSTVLTLKKAIRRHFEIHQRRNKCDNVKISWRYIWRNYNLQHCGEVMDNDQKLLADHGVENKSEIKFVKKLRKRHK